MTAVVDTRATGSALHGPERDGAERAGPGHAAPEHTRPGSADLGPARPSRTVPAAGLDGAGLDGAGLDGAGSGRVRRQSPAFVNQTSQGATRGAYRDQLAPSARHAVARNSAVRVSSPTAVRRVTGLTAERRRALPAADGVVACARPRQEHEEWWLLSAAAFMFLMVVLVGLFGLGGTGESVPGATTVVRVSGGDTLWSIAERNAPGSDPRDVVQRIVELNDLGAATARPGQALVVPVRGQ